MKFKVLFLSVGILMALGGGLLHATAFDTQPIGRLLADLAATISTSDNLHHQRATKAVQQFAAVMEELESGIYDVAPSLKKELIEFIELGNTIGTTVLKVDQVKPWHIRHLQQKALAVEKASTKMVLRQTMHHLAEYVLNLRYIKVGSSLDRALDYFYRPFGWAWKHKKVVIPGVLAAGGFAYWWGTRKRAQESTSQLVQTQSSTGAATGAPITSDPKKDVLGVQPNRSAPRHIIKIDGYRQTDSKIKALCRGHGAFCGGHSILMNEIMLSEQTAEKIQAKIADHAFLAKRLPELSDKVAEIRVAHLFDREPLTKENFDSGISSMEAKAGETDDKFGRAFIDYLKAHKAEIINKGFKEWGNELDAKIGKTHRHELMRLCKADWLWNDEIDQLLDQSRSTVFLSRYSDISESIFLDFITKTTTASDQKINELLQKYTDIAQLKQIKSEFKAYLLTDPHGLIQKIKNLRERGISQGTVLQSPGHWFSGSGMIYKHSPTEYGMYVIDTLGADRTKEHLVLAVFDLFTRMPLPREEILDAFVSMLIYANKIYNYAEEAEQQILTNKHFIPDLIQIIGDAIKKNYINDQFFTSVKDEASQIFDSFVKDFNLNKDIGINYCGKELGKVHITKETTFDDFYNRLVDLVRAHLNAGQAH